MRNGGNPCSPAGWGSLERRPERHPRPQWNCEGRRSPFSSPQTLLHTAGAPHSHPDMRPRACQLAVLAQQPPGLLRNGPAQRRPHCPLDHASR